MGRNSSLTIITVRSQGLGGKDQMAFICDPTYCGDIEEGISFSISALNGGWWTIAFADFERVYWRAKVVRLAFGLRRFIFKLSNIFLVSRKLA